MSDSVIDMTLSEGELTEAIMLMRAIGVDLQKYEVKSNRRELTKDIARTLSAFSNGSGGYIICGISKKSGFAPVDGFDAQAIQDSLAHACNESLQPPVRSNIDVLLFEGSPVVVAAIPAMRPSDKPCYIKASDRYKGSYIRTGDGDMRLSPYEVDRLIDEHRQPRHDEAIVENAELSDFDETLVQALLARERRIHARNFAKLADREALVRLGAVRPDVTGKFRPTLSGYRQSFG